MAISMRSVKAAYVVAFAIAGLMIEAALTRELFLLPFALIPLMAGVGIVRRRVWSAYGFALFLSAQLLLLPVVLSRSGGLQQDASTTACAKRGVIPNRCRSRIRPS